jgi:hypothetical protein
MAAGYPFVVDEPTFLDELQRALVGGWPAPAELERLAEGERLVAGLFPSPLGPLTIGYGVDGLGRAYGYALLGLPAGWEGEISGGDSWGTLTALRFYGPEDEA